MSQLSAQRASGGYGVAEVVHEVDLRVEGGRCIAVLGPNGAGKSTLLRLLAGILPLTGGEILLEGRPLATWRRRQLARRLTLVPQAVAFTFPLTVEEVVNQGRAPHLGPWRPPTAADRRAVHRALREVGLEGKAQVSVHRLSGGERQRVVLARALAVESNLLLLDEPASALDLHHQVALAGALRRRLQAGVGVVLVAHDVNLALALAEEVVVLANGRVAARGRPADVLAPDLFAGVFGVEAEFLARADGSPVMVPKFS